jgi:hypothetical protein
MSLRERLADLGVLGSIVAITLAVVKVLTSGLTRSYDTQQAEIDKVDELFDEGEYL